MKLFKNYISLAHPEAMFFFIYLTKKLLGFYVQASMKIILKAIFLKWGKNYLMK